LKKAVADLPFPSATVAYIAKGLELADVAPDRAWLIGFEAPQPSFFEQAIILARADAYMHFKRARAAVPRSQAHWELAAFFEAAIIPAAFDLRQGKLDDFLAFAFLYERLLGPSSVNWLPSLYLAAAAVPSIESVHRAKLIGRFAPEFLDRDRW
jgi:hypothetical protein